MNGRKRNTFPHFFVFIVSLVHYSQGLGCLKPVCFDSKRFPRNELIRCSDDGYCGHYKAIRRNDLFVDGVDLKCRENDIVYAPFDGELYFYQPLGVNADDQCGANEGLKISGHGQWLGYYAVIGTIRPFKFGGKVRAGEKLGRAGNIDCSHSSSSFNNFVRFQLFRNGKPIDPTSHLIDCMCTGQICETNRINAYIGSPFKFDSRYNGIRGWELKCGDVNGLDGELDKELGKGEFVPKIYSPIDGNIIGRIRVESVPGESYSGCENDGIFIVGAGKWLDYEVRVFNARFRENLELGQQNVEQGQHIGYRLSCGNSPESIFLEVRFQGALIDITPALNASDCRHQKKFNKLHFFR